MIIIRAEFQLFFLASLICFLSLAHKGIHCTTVLLGQQFTQIGLCTVGISVQSILIETVCFLPSTILQRNITPLKQIGKLISDLAFCHGTFVADKCLRSWNALRQNLLNTPEQILHSPHLAHILCLQFGKLLGHIIGIDILIAWNQMLGFVFCHQLQIPAPLVLNPDGVIVFVVRAEGQHDFSAVQGGEDIGLIFLPQLILQRNPGEEHPVALIGQGIIHILRNHRIDGAVAILGSLLVADENIIGFFLAGNFQNALSDFFNLLCFLAVYSARQNIRILNSLLQIRILHNGFKGAAMAGGDLLPGGRIVHILDAVLA